MDVTMHRLLTRAAAGMVLGAFSALVYQLATLEPPPPEWRFDPGPPVDSPDETLGILLNWTSCVLLGLLAVMLEELAVTWRKRRGV